MGEGDREQGREREAAADQGDLAGDATRSVEKSLAGLGARARPAWWKHTTKRKQRPS